MRQASDLDTNSSVILSYLAIQKDLEGLLLQGLRFLIGYYSHSLQGLAP